MAIRISATLFNAGRDDDRISGLQPASSDSTVYFGGMVITQDQSDASGKTFKSFDGGAVVGATNAWPLGLIIEPSQGYAKAGASGDTAAGQGFDSLDYARGGDYSAFHRPGNFVDVYDDQRNTTQVTVNAAAQNQSCPFVANRTWAVGNRVFATAAALDTTLSRKGLLDNVNAAGAGGAQIGIVRAVSGTGNDTVLTIELQIAISAS